MKSLLSVLTIAGFVLVMASGCGDDDIDTTPMPPPSGDAGTEPTPDAAVDPGEPLDGGAPGETPDASPIGDAATEPPSDAGSIADADTDAGDAQ